MYTISQLLSTCSSYIHYGRSTDRHSREAAQAAGYSAVPLFPTATTLFTFWGNTKMGRHLIDIGVNVMGALHGEEEYEYLAPIYPGDVLTGVTTLVDGKTRKGQTGSMDILTLEVRYTNQHGQPVLNVREVGGDTPAAGALRRGFGRFQSAAHRSQGRRNARYRRHHCPRHVDYGLCGADVE